MRDLLFLPVETEIRHPQVFLKRRAFETSHVDQLQNFREEAPPAPGTQGRV